ncbi:hypothetical protein, partial [Kitasatospora sp. NPDC059571]|uniref:hypothetical protein n=1 Tax=Kitasatospora sp. NPDC059571 TaxID=3346871 RepID=UPI00368289C6
LTTLEPTVHLSPSRRDRAPAPSPFASDGDLRRAQRRASATRAGIWASLAAGWLGLAAAVALPQIAQGASVIQAAAPPTIAPPTGYAEQFVELWLRGTPDGQSSEALRTMAPTIDALRLAGLARATVEKVVAVRSVPMGGRTWQVTVAATMVLPAAAQGDGDAQSSAQGGAQSSAQGLAQDSAQGRGAQGGGAQAGKLAVRYFAVPVQMVRSTASAGAPDALSVVAAPALVAVPPLLSGVDPVQRSYAASISDGPIRQTVTDYLTAYLTGRGDSIRFLSPGVRVPSPGAVYTSIGLDTLAATGPVPSAPADGTVGGPGPDPRHGRGRRVAAGLPAAAAGPRRPLGDCRPRPRRRLFFLFSFYGCERLAAAGSFLFLERGAVMGAQTVVLAGAVQNFGNAWAERLKTWIGAGLMIALGAIVTIHAIRKMSIKAAIGGLIGLVICWSIYANRTSIA